MTMMVEKISAVTFRVLNMKASVRFYGDVLGMEIVFGGKMPLSLLFAPRAAAGRELFLQIEYVAILAARALR